MAMSAGNGSEPRRVAHENEHNLVILIGELHPYSTAKGVKACIKHYNESMKADRKIWTKHKPFTFKSRLNLEFGRGRKRTVGT